LAQVIGLANENRGIRRAQSGSVQNMEQGADSLTRTLGGVRKRL
jgi:hypothetical protein